MHVWPTCIVPEAMDNSCYSAARVAALLSQKRLLQHLGERHAAGVVPPCHLFQLAHQRLRFRGSRLC